MASSSHPHQTLKNYNNTKELNFLEKEKEKEEEEEEEEEEEWLKLGLGLGSSSGISCKKIEDHTPKPNLASPSSQALRSSQIELGLGFEQGSGLEPKDNKGLEGVVVMESSTSDYRNWLSSSDNCNYYSDNNDDKSLMLWPSCPQELPVPIPCDTHHYTATSPYLWFTLCSSTDRSGEALPQIPKAYIRVRDENITVFMVKKYLVRKLGLSNEVEIDISCMGESLSHIQTLKQVRDTIWLPRLVESINSTTSSLVDSHDMAINHLMSLLYRKH